MNWKPISEGELSTLIDNAVKVMEPYARSLWGLIRIRPVKWKLPPWGDLGGGFWVVGILGNRVIWYNDIEGGFNVSTFQAYGIIYEYLCNQDELQHTLYFLLQNTEIGE